MDCPIFSLDLEHLAPVDVNDPPPRLTPRETVIPMEYPDSVGFDNRAVIGIGNLGSWTPLSQSPFPPVVRGVAFGYPESDRDEALDEIALLRVDRDSHGARGILSLSMAVRDREADIRDDETTWHYLRSGNMLSLPDHVSRWHPFRAKLITLSESHPRIVNLNFRMSPFLDRGGETHNRVQGACLFSGSILVSNAEYVPGVGVGCRLLHFPA